MRDLLYVSALSLLLLSLSRGDEEIAKGRLEVKAFIHDHADLYGRFNVQYIAGANPDLVFLNKDDQEIRRIDVSEMTTDEICNLMDVNGFKKTEPEEVPPPPVDRDL